MGEYYGGKTAFGVVGSGNFLLNIILVYFFFTDLIWEDHHFHLTLRVV